jgi:hypothetical protein
MIVDGHRELFLRAVLPDDVAIQKLLDLRGTRELPRGRGSLLALFILKNGLANADAFVADVGARIVRRRADQLFDLFLRLMAKGTAQRLVWVKFFTGMGASSPLGCDGVSIRYSRPIFPRSKRETRSDTNS